MLGCIVSFGLSVIAIKFLMGYIKQDGKVVDLTKKEYELLTYLVQNKNIVLTREQILNEVWGYSYIGETNVVDVYIRYLRAKIDEAFGKKYILTIRGVGYYVKEE